MATSQLVTDTKKFDGMIVDVITDLRKKHKPADCESIHKETVKLADFSNASKEDLMNRINTLLIDEKILNKRNRNLDSYHVNENISPDNNNFSETPHYNILFNTSTDDTEPIFPVTSKTPSITKEASTSINPIPELTIGFEAYIISAFKYCPLIWMFSYKTSNNQINKIHKRSLRLVYEMQDANFEDLLLKDSSWNDHESNIRTLLIKIYNSINNLSPPIMKNFFGLKNTRYDL